MAMKRKKTNKKPPTLAGTGAFVVFIAQANKSCNAKEVTKWGRY